MDRIRLQQAQAALPLNHSMPVHQPEMLYIGCVDARLDPIEDIGIEKGKALIFRNISALVLKEEHPITPGEIMHSADIPQNVGIGAVLDFFLNHIVLPGGKIKHIVVSGHTDCGGLKACQFQQCNDHDHYLPLYLQSLEPVRRKVMAEAAAHNWNDAQTLQALEKESVRLSMANLLTYPSVQEALQRGLLEIHGWVIDTATQSITEMNLQTLEFEPMA